MRSGGTILGAGSQSRPSCLAVLLPPCRSVVLNSLRHLEMYASGEAPEEDSSDSCGSLGACGAKSPADDVNRGVRSPEPMTASISSPAVPGHVPIYINSLPGDLTAIALLLTYHFWGGNSERVCGSRERLLEAREGAATTHKIDQRRITRKLLGFARSCSERRLACCEVQPKRSGAATSLHFH